MESNILAALITGSFAVVATTTNFVLEKLKKEHHAATPKFANHQVFSRLDMLKNHINMSFEFPNKGKELVFKDLLASNLEIWNVVLKELADKLDELEDTTDSIELYNLATEYYSKGLRETNNYYKSSHYTDNEQKALDIVMEKFNKWNYPRVQSLHDTFATICNSQFYSGTKVKSAVILDMYLTMFVDTINDAELTLNELNGDLKGLIFRGVTI